jgi:hypothetical protein
VRLAERIDARLATDAGLGLADLQGRVDFALLFAMVHEVEDPAAFFRDVTAALRTGGTVLLAEPRGHVPEPMFAATLERAAAHGLAVTARPSIASSHAAVLTKN